MLPHKSPQEAPVLRDREYWRRISIIAAWILLILLIIAAIIMIAPGLLDAGPANATAQDTTGSGLPGAILERFIPGHTTQGTAVFRDIP